MVTCEDCIFWENDFDRVDKESDGVCRRYPPIMEKADNRCVVTSKWETICGEFFLKPRYGMLFNTATLEDQGKILQILCKSRRKTKKEKKPKKKK